MNQYLVYSTNAHVLDEAECQRYVSPRLKSALWAGDIIIVQISYCDMEVEIIILAFKVFKKIEEIRKKRDKISSA